MVAAGPCPSLAHISAAVETRRCAVSRWSPPEWVTISPHQPATGTAPPGLQGSSTARQGLCLPLKGITSTQPPTCWGTRPGRTHAPPHMPRCQDAPSLALGLRSSLGPVVKQPSAPVHPQDPARGPTLHRTLKAPSAGTGNLRRPHDQRPSSRQGPAPRCPAAYSWPSAGPMCEPTCAPRPCWHWAAVRTEARQLWLEDASAAPPAHRCLDNRSVSMATGLSQRKEKQASFSYPFLIFLITQAIHFL